MILEKSLIKNEYEIDSNYPTEFERNLKQFLEKSKEEYPINIVASNEESINIILLKNIKNTQYNFEYENAISKLLKFLIKIIPDYGLCEIDYNNDDYGFHPTFNIHVPTSISSETLDKYWDDIFEEVVNFVESEDIEFILDDLSIILCR